MPFRVIILGSGTIVPAADRRATSIYVEAGDTAFLLDCGPGTLDALEERGIPYQSIHSIFLTHFHPDHTLDLGRLLAAKNADRGSISPSSVRLYGPAGLRSFVERWHTLYPSTVPKRAFLTIIEIGPGRVPGAEADVAACRAKHGDGNALAYAVGHGARRLVYTGDSGPSDELGEFARGVDLLIAECSFPDTTPVEGHLTPEEAGRLAAAAGARRLALVHLYPVFGESDPAAAARRRFDGTVEVAWDGLEIDLES
jgi:ribonuclease BN (tRNA processing enzyme)